MIHPSFTEFKRLAKTHPVVPMYLECLADELTPMALFHARYKSSPQAFLLESAEGGERVGRYSFAAFDMERTLRAERGEGDYLMKELRAIVKGRRAAEVAGLPRFFGGAVGFASYDIVRNFERLPDNNPDRLGIPEAVFFLPRDLYIFDHLAQTVKIVRCVNVRSGGSLSNIYHETKEALERLARNIRLPSFDLTTFQVPGRVQPSFKPAEKRQFEKAVRRAKSYIAAGDIIQVVPSRRITVPFKSSSLDVYRSLRRINPSPYMFFIKDGDLCLVGSSPEALVRLENGKAETRPIAGTRPRGATPEEDNQRARELLADKKERAEHVMLVDLARNDLGRVCRPGTVKAPEFMSVERYSHVMHIVSSVRGELAAGKDAFDLFRAAFPAGTLSGAPKIRAMEIIDELETTRRGPYGGSVGYFSYTGNMDMAITIRTVLLKGGKAHVQVGAGVVADSDPAKEFLETQNKAAAMMGALKLAETLGKP